MKKLLIVLASLVLVGCATDNVEQTDVTTQETISEKQSAGQTVEDKVASHNTLSDCRTVINGKSYDLTSYAPKHPGGTGAIAAVCGKDGSSLFEGKHGGNAKIEAMLESLQVN